jgi:hypothetical protein
MESFIGDPVEQIQYWDNQDLPFDCAVVAQADVINQYLDTPISETQAVFDAAFNGWLTPDGTLPDDVGNLLDLYGVPNHHVEGATFEQLAAELQAGNRVIVGVRAGELWYDGTGSESEPADHAIVVTGIDLSSPDHPMVIVNDSGKPDGAFDHYPLDKFMEAWENGNFSYVATDAPPPGHSALDFNLSSFLAQHVPDFDADRYALLVENVGAMGATPATLSAEEWDQIR